MNDKAMSITMPTELYEALKKAAKERNISVAALIRMICSEFLKSK